MPCLVTRVQAIDQRVADVLGSTHTATGRADVPDYRRIVEALFVAEENITLETWVAVRRRTATPWRRIVVELSDITDGLIDVSPQTLINWYDSDRETAA